MFLFLHLFDLHKPYRRSRTGLSGYDAELEYVDGLLGVFKRRLVDSGWWDKSVVVLFSDHGESLGEHGEESHGYFIYQSTMRVPLLWHWPARGGEHEARVDRPVGLLDVAPAVLHAVGLRAPGSFLGADLFGAGGPGVFGESVHAHDAFGWAPLWSWRAGSYKFIDAPKPELYDLQLDPGELTNIVGRHAAEAERLRAQLRAMLSRYERKGSRVDAMSPKTRETLGSLGYLAPGPKTAGGGNGADPKDRLGEFRLYEDAQVQLANRRTGEAIRTLRALLARDPGNVLARRDLGAAYLSQGLYGQARESLERVVAAAPDDYMSQYELGLADAHLGRKAEALEHVESACHIAPKAAQCSAELAALRGGNR